MSGTTMKVHFKFLVGDIIYHKLSSNELMVLERHYQDGSSGEGEIQYLCRESDENMINENPIQFREFELEVESRVIKEIEKQEKDEADIGE